MKRLTPTGLFLLISASMLLSCSAVEPFLSLDGIEGSIDDLSPRRIAIDAVRVLTQPDSGTCGITTVAVMSNFFNDADLTVSDLMAKYGVVSGQSTDQEALRAWLAAELPGYSIEYRHDDESAALLGEIHASLALNRPVAIFFGSPNPYNAPYYDFHASTVTGIDLDLRTITIANSYGYMETMTLLDFLNRMAFTELDKYPQAQRFAIGWGLIPTNMIFLVK